MLLEPPARPPLAPLAAPALAAARLCVACFDGKRNKHEIYVDIDLIFINLYRCIRHSCQKQIQEDYCAHINPMLGPGQTFGYEHSRQRKVIEVIHHDANPIVVNFIAVFCHSKMFHYMVSRHSGRKGSLQSSVAVVITTKILTILILFEWTR